jgi:hypothetical protein
MHLGQPFSEIRSFRDSKNLGEGFAPEPEVLQFFLCGFLFSASLRNAA